MSEHTYRTDVVIAGGGLAGMATAYELLDSGMNVLIIDKDVEERFGGLARESFGGVHLIDTPHQRKLGLKDDPDLALSDWLRYAEFDEEDELPRAWAQFYCENSEEYIYRFLVDRGIEFLPIVNWPERGLDPSGNSVPRWHIAWGTGFEIADRMRAALDDHRNRRNLQILFEHEVSGFEMIGEAVTGVRGLSMGDGESFRVAAEHVVIASGGMCGGDMSMMFANWYEPWGRPPKVMLNGAHEFADGLLHERAEEEARANITHLDRQWHYAAGVHHPADRRPNDGLSLVPPRSALWFNAEGARIMNPGPLIGYTDTRHLVESILKEPGGYSWQVLNRKIALRELAVSGSDFMPGFRYKKRLKVIRDLAFGNRELVDRLLRECPEDFVVADSLDELAERMTAANLFGLKIDPNRLKADVSAYDEEIERGRLSNRDEQLKLLQVFREYVGDRIRMCNNQKIDDRAARPLIAIREFILSRKSLGGIQTDLGSRVLTRSGKSVDGLYAVGEAAGFGGGGIHGRRSLEGTFLGGCVLTGRVAGKTIARGG